VISRKMRVELDVEQANVLCAGRRELGYAGHGPREDAVLIQNTQAARQPFREENLSVRQKCQAPGSGQMIDQRGYRNLRFPA